eukprot:gene281-6696_t
MSEQNLYDEEEIILDDEERQAEEEGEDLFGDGWEDDYDDEQDHYDPSQIDDTVYDEMDTRERLRIDDAIDKRRKEQALENSKPGSLRDIILKYSEIEAPSRRETSSSSIRKTSSDINHSSDEEDEEEEDDEDDEINFQEVKGKIKEWIIQTKPRKKISKKFKTFLTQFKVSEASKYLDRIEKMASENKSTLEVSYSDLSQVEEDLCILLADEPTEMLNIFSEVALSCVLMKFPNYKNIHEEIYVRVSDLPECESIRDLRQPHLNQLIKVTGVITRRTSVFPQLKLVKYDCACGNQIGPIGINSRGNNIPKPSSCPSCKKSGPFTINQNLTVYRNYQKITLQETPGTIPAGRIPRSKDVILINDLIDCVRPGEEVDITGIYKHSYDASLNSKQGFPVFATVIEANHISKRVDQFSISLSSSDKKKIIQLSKDPKIQQKIIKSIAPSIFGHENIKLAIALSLFGGQSKNIGGKHRIRGDINILLVGDPGVAKSQFLKYIEKTANRAVYTTGKGSSAVGLTASVHKDPLTKEWTLEGGALVLADNGTCLIDEFDKMSDQDRTSIHEAMEQQTISISKAGIVTTLQARASIVAAANPVKGNYDSTKTFHQNVQLSDPILSRFDFLCVVRDLVDPILDEKLATFVVNSHFNHHPHNEKLKEQQEDVIEEKKKKINEEEEEEEEEEGDSIIPQDLLKKYILYSKLNFHPKLQKINNEKLVQFYKELRKESFNGGLPISVRHLESLFRLAEANARLHLRDFVRDDDINTAIGCMLDSFISTQKHSIAKMLQKKFAKYLHSNNDQILLHLLQNFIRESAQISQDENQDSFEIDLDEFEARAKQYDIFNVHPFLKSKSFENQFIFDQKKKTIKKIFIE